MIYGSVCSGIEAASVAWEPLGWKPSFFSEIEAFPRAVLAHRWPEVKCHGDFTTIKAGDYRPIDLLVGGTPCQSFSVAGLRGGLGDDRGNLALEYLRLADRLRPRWLVWENVPGVLSSNSGRDFGSILGGLVELGYGFAYRVLDAQFFGVAQRRRRVFVVGYLGDWRRAAAVLFERHSLSGHPAPRREARQTAPTIPSRSFAGGGLGTDFDCDGGLIPSVAGTFKACTGSGGWSNSADHAAAGYMIPVAHTLKGEGFDVSEDGTGRGTPIVPVAFSITPSNSNKDYNARQVEKAQALTAGGNRPSARGGDLVCFSAKDHGADAMNDLSPTLRAGGHSKSHANAGVMPAVAFALRGRDAGAVPEMEGDGSRVGALRAASGGSSRDYIAASAVRRLTPRECERLQGFPDDYTLIPYRKGIAADGPRYKALGNSMAVPVMAWIGRRIQAVEALSLPANAPLPRPKDQAA